MRALAVVLAVGAMATSAWARGGTAVVATGTCAAADAGEQARALRAALSKRLSGEVLSEAETAATLGGLAAAPLAELDRRLATGKTELFNGDYAGAEHALVTLRDELFTLPPSANRWQRLESVAALLALSEQKQGRPADAEATLLKVMRVDPAFHPDEDAYPPSILKLAQQLAAKVKAQPKGQLTLRAGPNGALFVDGKPVDQIDGIAIATLPHGEYRVEVSFAGRRAPPRTVQLTETASVTFDPAFDGALLVDGGPCFVEGATREAQLEGLLKLGHVIGAHKLIFVRIDEPSPKERFMVATALNVDAASEAGSVSLKLEPTGTNPAAMDAVANYFITGIISPPLQPSLVSGAPSTADAPLKDLDTAAQPKPAVAAVEQPASSPSSSSSSGLRTGAYVAGGVGVAALIGAGIFALDLKSANNITNSACGGGACTGADASDRASRDQKLAFVGVGLGVAAGVTAVILWMQSSDAPAGGGATTSLHLTPGGLAGTF